MGENVPPILGEYGGLNLGVMEELGYTVRKKDENGDPVDEIDWEKTRAVQIRSNYIYINLKGRDKYGIVEAKDKYDLEEQIISDLYSYRDKATGKRVGGIAMRNKDSVVLGLGGAECGDIVFTINEGFNRLHGDGLSTAEGYAQTSVTPVFLAAGEDIKEGTIYPLLVRLEKKNYISSTLRPSPLGPRRKYYSITDEGLTYLHGFINCWNQVQKSVNEILNMEESL